MNDKLRQALPIFLIALFVRLVSAGITTVTDLNPASLSDAVGFSRTAASIARGLPESLPIIFSAGPIGTYPLWGSFLAPFWLFPGPSGFYARMGNALLGAFAIYNVYLIARFYHSHRAGVVAALPMVLYPSFIAVHSTLLREAIVLFGLTTATRIAMTNPGKLNRWRTYVIGLGVLYVAYILRPENGIIYVTAIGTALAVYAYEKGVNSKRILAALVAASPLSIVFSIPLLRKGVTYLAQTRQSRTHGSAVYLPDTIPRTIGELIGFSWIGAAYFLYSPFPWMIRTIPGGLIGLEGIINIGYTILAIAGIRAISQKNASATVGLLVGLFIGGVLYGVGTGNYGAAQRHRQMFLWIIFLFGGVGFAEKVRVIGFSWPRRA